MAKAIKSAAPNQAKPTSDAEGVKLAEGTDGAEVQTTLGDMVPDQDDALEELTGKWVAAKSKVEKANENLKAAKAALRDAMGDRELQVYHCRTLNKKVVAKDELTVRVLTDSPDGEEG